ncbi:MAG: malonic semialdehyde reductase [Planctomycetota bacterium]
MARTADEAPIPTPHPLAQDVLEQLFTAARTHHHWQPRPVPDDLLRQVYDLAKWGPTSMNCSPMRILFVQSPAAKEKLYPALMGSNKAQVEAAPVTAIVAFDEQFQDRLPHLYPVFNAKPMFDANAELRRRTALQNGTLQGAYLLLAAPTLGLDVGPMAGFDNAKVDAAFFAGTTWQSNFLMNLGYGDPAKLHPRGPRLAFDEVAKIV